MEMLIKMPIRFCYTCIRVAKIKTLTMPNADVDVQQLDHSYIAVENVK